jgi:hypothetical protein
MIFSASMIENIKTFMISSKVGREDLPDRHVVIDCYGRSPGALQILKRYFRRAKNNGGLPHAIGVPSAQVMFKADM